MHHVGHVDWDFSEPPCGYRQADGSAGRRVVFNDALRARQEAHAAGRPYLTDAELSARLTAAKATPTGSTCSASTRSTSRSPWAASCSSP
jgi:hypothetical protein